MHKPNSSSKHINKLCYMDTESSHSSTENYVFSNVCDQIIMSCNAFDCDLYLSTRSQTAICLQAVIASYSYKVYHTNKYKNTTITLRCIVYGVWLYEEFNPRKQRKYSKM